MTPELAAALLVVAVITVYGIVAFARASRPNLDRAVNDALCQPLCSTCQTRPVPIPGGICGACEPRQYYECALHGQRLPAGQIVCGVCRHELEAEVDRILREAAQ